MHSTVDDRSISPLTVVPVTSPVNGLDKPIHVATKGDHPEDKLNQWILSVIDGCCLSISDKGKHAYVPICKGFLYIASSSSNINDDCEKRLYLQHDSPGVVLKRLFIDKITLSMPSIVYFHGFVVPFKGTKFGVWPSQSQSNRWSSHDYKLDLWADGSPPSNQSAIYGALKKVAENMKSFYL